MLKSEKMEKPKVAFYDLTGCQGCVLSVIYNEDDLLDIIGAVDIKAFRFIMGETYDGPLDICFIEGSVVSKDDLKILKNLRERSKILVALGACAHVGNIQSIRNFTDEKEIDYLKYDKTEQNQDTGEPKPIHEYVNVEYSIPGCPPDRDEIKTFFKDILLGKEFRNHKDPVCVECKLNENNCLLDNNIICLGPITQGNCKAICTTNGLKCYGCRGLTYDANFKEYFKMMEEKGFNTDEVKKIMNTFMARSVNEKLKGTKWETSH